MALQSELADTLQTILLSDGINRWKNPAPQMDAPQAGPGIDAASGQQPQTTQDVFGGQAQASFTDQNQQQPQDQSQQSQAPQQWLAGGLRAAVGAPPAQMAQIGQQAAQMPPVQGSNLLEQAQKLLAHPLIQGAIKGIGAGLGSPYHTSPRAKFGHGLAAGIDEFGQQTNVQAAERDRQQQLQQNATAQQQTAQNQQARLDQGNKQIAQNAAIHGLQTPEENAAWIEATKKAGDPNLIKAQQIAGDPKSPTFKADALKIWQQMNQNDQKEAILNARIEHQKALEEQKAQHDKMIHELRQQGNELAAKRLELEGVKIAAQLDKIKTETEKILQSDANKKVDQYRQFSADYMAKNQVDMMLPEGKERFEEYKRNIARNVIKMPTDPETGKAWDDPTAKVGKELAEMPPAAQNKDRIIRDTKTGKRFKSDGKNWVAQP